MAKNANFDEIDHRFPTGNWTGFFLQPDSRQRHRMELSLRFVNQTISGNGSDLVGDFMISGSYNHSDAACSWEKAYIGQHRVMYSGIAFERGIVGEWCIAGQPEFWTGPFFIWPQPFGNLELLFEKAFLEFTLNLMGTNPQVETLKQSD